MSAKIMFFGPGIKGRFMICLGKRKVQLRKKIIIKCLREERFITVKFKIIKSVGESEYESLQNVQWLLCKCGKSFLFD